jgi:hypothetical protein
VDEERKRGQIAVLDRRTLKLLHAFGRCRCGICVKVSLHIDRCGRYGYY